MEATRGCPFCDAKDALLRNELAHARFDTSPVNPGHLLLIPNRHVSDFFDTTAEEKKALMDLMEEAKALVDQRFSPQGYNVGINVGACAGQTVWHVHVHLIPRYKGDVANPRGGVRGVIPARQSY